MDRIPALPGSYALHLFLPSPIMLAVGRLGSSTFPYGDYLYLGSARGPGGLKARLAHHLKIAAHPHWHLDYLRPWASVQGVFFALEHTGQGRPHSSRPLECLWSRCLARMSGALVPSDGFGAADCRCGCPAHLVALPTGLKTEDIHHRLQTCGDDEQEPSLHLVLYAAAVGPLLSG